MKKVSILLLLTVVLVSFTFAIEGVGDFTAKVQADLGIVPSPFTLSVTPSLEYARDFGPINLDVTLKLPIGIIEDFTFGINIDTLKITYSLALGPGTLGIYLENTDIFPIKPSSDFSGGLTIPGVKYAVPVGPGTLTPELGLSLAYAPDFALDSIFFKVDYALDFGLDVYLKAVYGVSDKGQYGTSYGETEFEASYAFAPFKAGLNVNAAGTFDGVLTIKPFGEFAINDAISVGLEVPIKTKQGGGDDIGIGVGIWGSYKF